MSRISRALRRQVQRRARGLCEYCMSCEEYTGMNLPWTMCSPNRVAVTRDSRTCAGAVSGATTTNKRAPNRPIGALDSWLHSLTLVLIRGRTIFGGAVTSHVLLAARRVVVPRSRHCG